MHYDDDTRTLRIGPPPPPDFERVPTPPANLYFGSAASALRALVGLLDALRLLEPTSFAAQRVSNWNEIIGLLTALESDAMLGAPIRVERWVNRDGSEGFALSVDVPE